MIERFAYAKINLFLDIKGIRGDGYHNIVSVMQTVDWADKITIDKIASKEIALTCSDETIPIDRRNTVYRAAELFLAQITDPNGVRLHIEKHIPSAAGLAGGSADAAATLLGLNDIFGKPFSMDQLLKLGRSVGADVPFCLLGGTKLVSGIGEVIEPFPMMPSCYLVCAKLGEGVSTPLAYRALDERYSGFPRDAVKYEKLACLREEFERGSLKRLSDGIYNIFEAQIEQIHSSVSMLKSTLRYLGANVTMMSGSGPAVFGVFDTQESAENGCAELRRLGAACEVCRPISYGGEQ